MVRSRPSAVDSAAARPPAATKPDTTYGRPAISGVASTIRSPPITISASCTMPSLLTSTMLSSDGSTFAHAEAQAGSAANELPTKLVYMSYFASTARQGAVKYNRKMHTSDQNTEVRASCTLGVV